MFQWILKIEGQTPLQLDESLLCLTCFTWVIKRDSINHVIILIVKNFPKRKMHRIDADIYLNIGYHPFKM